MAYKMKTQSVLVRTRSRNVEEKDVPAIAKSETRDLIATQAVDPYSG